VKLVISRDAGLPQGLRERGEAKEGGGGKSGMFLVTTSDLASKNRVDDPAPCRTARGQRARITMAASQAVAIMVARTTFQPVQPRRTLLQGRPASAARRPLACQSRPNSTFTRVSGSRFRSPTVVPSRPATPAQTRCAINQLSNSETFSAVTMPGVSRGQRSLLEKPGTVAARGLLHASLGSPAIPSRKAIARRHLLRHHRLFMVWRRISRACAIPSSSWSA